MDYGFLMFIDRLRCLYEEYSEESIPEVKACLSDPIFVLFMSIRKSLTDEGLLPTYTEGILEE